MITKIVFGNWNLNFKEKKLRKVTYKNLLFIKKINKTKTRTKFVFDHFLPFPLAAGFLAYFFKTLTYYFVF